MIALLLAVSLIAAPDSVPVAQTLSLQECVRLALNRNADVVGATRGVDAATAARASMAGNFGPRVRVEGNYLRYPEAQTISFAPEGAPTPPPPATPVPPFVVREDTTTSLTVSVIQPITPLLAVHSGYRARDFGVDAARLHRKAVERDIAYQATEAYYRLLQAQRLAEVAATSVKQVEAQVTRARAFEKRGAIGRNDVLRAEIALARVTQRRIQADGAVTLASARLASVLGLPPGTEITPTSAPDSPAPPPSQTADAAVAQALTGRGELGEVDARIAQARAGRNAAWTRLSPQLNAVASYSQISGSAFQEKETRFVGLLLTWDAWDWGSSYFGAREAAAQVRQAEAASAKVRDGVALDARAAHIAYSSSVEGLSVSQAAVAQAEENYRIESRRFEENANTTFDVLDAESLLTQARAQYQTALYDSHIAAANLDRAVGKLPDGAAAK